MSRTSAIDALLKRTPVVVTPPAERVSEYYAINAFGLDKLKMHVSSGTYEKLEASVLEGGHMDKMTADAVAAAAKRWAISRGATHFTHWFQPLTGATAEKHDAFFNSLDGIEQFNGDQLTQQEPDASSFPSGGIRSTFEARGYTGWDPSSPMFIWGNTLCIPTVFVSYTGETLDFKGALLKADQALDKAATAVCKLFDRSVSSVSSSLGCEQEYFAIDRGFYMARPDLVMGGRTVFGHEPARGQQLEDHYFASIPTRIQNYMKDLEIEAWKLGIPVTTRHNEVAPAQFEIAPLFEDLNIAVDHNQLLMDLMDKVSERHGLKILLHEKPFIGLNGSGKHNNWSMRTDGGRNLLKPALTTNKDALYFLTFLVTTIKAVHVYGDLLRASIASAGNDFRLGANEAPPAIMSVFLGRQLSMVLDKLEESGEVEAQNVAKKFLELGIDTMPELQLDTTDRNRTSPFAFTGNKFEFRAVGSTANCALPMTVLCLIVAEQLTLFHEAVEAKKGAGAKKDDAILEVLLQYVRESKAIRFEGDGYSDEWVQEAANRGLPNVRDTPRALDALITEKTIAAFERHSVLTRAEVHARHEVWVDQYMRHVQIESRLIGDLALNHIIPTAIAYQNKLVINANGLKGLGLDPKAVITTINEVSTHIESIKANVIAMIEERKRINHIEDSRQKAIEYCDHVKERFFEPIRYAVDKLEFLVDDKDWPLPKYREMLFLR